MSDTVEKSGEPVAKYSPYESPPLVPQWLPPYFVPSGSLPPFNMDPKRNLLGPPRKRYFYFDSYDYEDCFKKIYYVTDYSVRAALFVSTVDLLTTRQSTYIKALGRVAGHVGRIGGSGLLASTIACSVANLRGKKDDQWNVPIGCASIGFIWGAKYHSSGLGAAVAVGMAIAGFIIKRADIQGWVIDFPADTDHTVGANGVFGGKYWGDFRIDKKDKYVSDAMLFSGYPDPGRKGLE